MRSRRPVHQHQPRSERDPLAHPSCLHPPRQRNVFEHRQPLRSQSPQRRQGIPPQQIEGPHPRDVPHRLRVCHLPGPRSPQAKRLKEPQHHTLAPAFHLHRRHGHHMIGLLGLRIRQRPAQHRRRKKHIRICKQDVLRIVRSQRRNRQCLRHRVRLPQPPMRQLRNVQHGNPFRVQPRIAVHDHSRPIARPVIHCDYDDLRIVLLHQRIQRRRDILRLVPTRHHHCQCRQAFRRNIPFDPGQVHHRRQISQCLRRSHAPRTCHAPRRNSRHTPPELSVHAAAGASSADVKEGANRAPMKKITPASTIVTSVAPRP